jgi:hypothetical protein
MKKSELKVIIKKMLVEEGIGDAYIEAEEEIGKEVNINIPLKISNAEYLSICDGIIVDGKALEEADAPWDDTNIFDLVDYYPATVGARNKVKGTFFYDLVIDATEEGFIVNINSIDQKYIKFI